MGCKLAQKANVVPHRSSSASKDHKCILYITSTGSKQELLNHKDTMARLLKTFKGMMIPRRVNDAHKLICGTYSQELSPSLQKEKTPG